MYWLRKSGIISVSNLGQPGANIWLRFKPDPKVLSRMGGLETLIAAIDDGTHLVAKSSHSIPKMKALNLGQGAWKMDNIKSIFPHGCLIIAVANQKYNPTLKD